MLARMRSSTHADTKSNAARTGIGAILRTVYSTCGPHTHCLEFTLWLVGWLAGRRRRRRRRRRHRCALQPVVIALFSRDRVWVVGRTWAFCRCCFHKSQAASLGTMRAHSLSLSLAHSPVPRRALLYYLLREIAGNIRAYECAGCVSWMRSGSHGSQ